MKRHTRVAPGTALLAVLLLGCAGFSGAQEPAVMVPLAAKSLLLDGVAVGDRLVVVGERGHILISIDGGATWSQVPVPTRSTLTAVDFADADTGCAVGHDAAIVYTRDGGASWELVHWAPEEERPFLTVRFLDRDRVIAAGAYGWCLESRDGGLTWQERHIDEADRHLNHLARSGADRLYLAAESGGLYRSDDRGETWRELPSPYGGSWFGTLPLPGGALLAFGLRGNLFRSEDAGETWREVPTGTRSLLSHGTVLGDGTVVVAGLAGTVLVSRDGGNSFLLHQSGDRRGISAVVPIAGGGLLRVGEGGVQPLNLPPASPPGGTAPGREGEGS